MSRAPEGTDPGSSEPPLSVILPTLNERETVELLVYALISILGREMGDRYEVLVVDDSTDDSFEYLRSRFSGIQGEERVRLLHREGSSGLASAIEFGIHRARGTYVAVMDSDLNHSPTYLPEMLRGLEEVDMVIGSRFVAGGGMIGARTRYLGSRLFNAFVRRAVGLETRDNLSGYWTMKRAKLLELAEQAVLFRGYGDYFMRVLHQARLADLKVREIPVVYFQRLNGKSKTRFGRDLLRYTRTALLLRRTT